MSLTSQQRRFGAPAEKKTMQEFGELFVEALPALFENLKIPGRAIVGSFRREPLFAQVEQAAEIQNAMRDVLVHPLTQEAQTHAEMRSLHSWEKMRQTLVF